MRSLSALHWLAATLILALAWPVAGAEALISGTIFHARLGVEGPGAYAGNLAGLIDEDQGIGTPTLSWRAEAVHLVIEQSTEVINTSLYGHQAGMEPETQSFRNAHGSLAPRDGYFLAFDASGKVAFDAACLQLHPELADREVPWHVATNRAPLVVKAGIQATTSCPASNWQLSGDFLLQAWQTDLHIEDGTGAYDYATGFSDSSELPGVGTNSHRREAYLVLTNAELAYTPAAMPLLHLSEVSSQAVGSFHYHTYTADVSGIRSSGTDLTINGRLEVNTALQGLRLESTLAGVATSAMDGQHVLPFGDATETVAWSPYAIGSLATVLGFGLIGVAAVLVNRRFQVAALEAQLAPRAQSHVHQAQTYLGTGHVLAACFHLRVALWLDPLDAQAWRLLGECHAETRPGKALDHYRRAYHLLDTLGGDDADLGDTAYRAARASARYGHAAMALHWIGIAARHRADYQAMAQEEPDFAGVDVSGWQRRGEPQRQ